MTPRLRTGNMLPKEGKATAPALLSSPFARSGLVASLFAGAMKSSPIRTDRSLFRSVPETTLLTDEDSEFESEACVELLLERAGSTVLERLGLTVGGNCVTGSLDTDWVT